jgi:hypothetical protein
VRQLVLTADLILLLRGEVVLDVEGLAISSGDLPLIMLAKVLMLTSRHALLRAPSRELNGFDQLSGLGCSNCKSLVETCP